MTLYHFQIGDRMVVSDQASVDDAQASGRWIAVDYSDDDGGERGFAAA